MQSKDITKDLTKTSNTITNTELKKHFTQDENKTNTELKSLPKVSLVTRLKQ